MKVILRENVKNAEKLSREVECLDLIIDAFSSVKMAKSILFAIYLPRS